MRRFLAFLLSIILLTAALVSGAFILVVLAAVIAGSALFLFLYTKITGRLPSGMHFYRFEQRTRHEESSAPQSIKVIEAEYEEIDGKK
jgi:hypothetical protein